MLHISVCVSLAYSKSRKETQSFKFAYSSHFNVTWMPVVSF